ncbi:Asp-tRNA(Asn)/Glu-tRNA(Gln) amidotransferase subunit GatA [Neomoorella thermoacetica]|uniref:Glutamyl-tRNA(Gln) amidotransferase subunit A n=2 Tax=Neomoorella thermoacetica TaxID=1525 RepID=GATA_MOOTA|nr:Asp-tRNA(Asn)/Glu-tRNA(Gln) amidotransferase subunit GatA [Moorella thermoacetica]Q2RGY4.1 RecName: Full=Glutamyl-tRNA(Gln) amidotransferase subunit A; Short=Glu-ADT subunit A [Moorella thermoacetica ATCC 39073]AKX94835.1 glutamyl-tRNA(Gln) amidotransferase subunit A [Moorella thermoacetica]AKX97466.1 glutamyl-tRNA(Gln) amidotransferase subunit A [Moorella thermoacetica]AOQ24976.1 Glutamyl-tRNA(Gln) amidotransferase subunit A [Moorella thermoacetica]OIQ54726.1 glutamyl-tRNA(Gln) amidotransf
MELYYLTAHELSDLLNRKEISSEEATAAIIDRIEAVDGRVQAYLTRTAEQALEEARAVDAARARGETLGPLAGVPMALKDNLCTEGVRTTCSSRMLADWVPPYDATVVRRLKEAGAVMLGKLNMDEFAMGSSTENSSFFPTRNPWDLERVPGGSSGGAVAAVAAGEAYFALGSDTGGSIRQPASFCGVVGMKPTYGRVSRYGLVAFASSLDQIGPITRDVTDCALVLEAIAGHDPLDSTSADLPVPDYRSALKPEVKGLKIGVPREYFGAGMEPEVAAIVRRAIAKLEELGAVCEETSLPHTEYALPAYYLVAPAEASSNLARYDGVSYGLRVPGKDIIEMYMNTRSQGFGPEVKRRIMLGTYALSSGYYDAYYLKALKVRTLIRRDFETAFEKYDLLATPTSPTVAFRLGEKAGDPLAMYLSDLCTIPINMAGLPALSLPCGFSQGLPVGLQLIGRPFAEATLLQAAYAFEQSTEYHRRRPELGVA